MSYKHENGGNWQPWMLETVKLIDMGKIRGVSLSMKHWKTEAAGKNRVTVYNNFVASVGILFGNDQTQSFLKVRDQESSTGFLNFVAVAAQ